MRLTITVELVAKIFQCFEISGWRGRHPFGGEQLLKYNQTLQEPGPYVRHGSDPTSKRQNDVM